MSEELRLTQQQHSQVRPWHLAAPGAGPCCAALVSMQLLLHVPVHNATHELHTSHPPLPCPALPWPAHCRTQVEQELHEKRRLLNGISMVGLGGAGWGACAVVGSWRHWVGASEVLTALCNESANLALPPQVANAAVNPTSVPPTQPTQSQPASAKNKKKHKVCLCTVHIEQPAPCYW